MSSVRSDVRSILRSLAKNPAFAVFSVLSLSLGVGATTAVFSATKTVLRQPIPIHEPSRVVALFSTSEGNPLLLPVSFGEYRDLRDGVASLESLALERSVWLTWAGEDQNERLLGTLVAGDYFDVLGIRPDVGRFFTADESHEDSGAAVVVLAHDFWRRALSGDPAVVGRKLVVNTRPFTVVGVAPRGFQGLSTLNPTQMWFPAGSYPYVLTGTYRDWFDLRDGRIFRGIGRLAAGSSLASARGELESLARHLEEDYPVENEGVTFEVLPVAQAMINPNQRGDYLQAGIALVGAVVVLLLISAVNVANLLIARAVDRRQEVAVRMALGVGRGRLAKQFFTEGLVLAVLGSAGGVLVALWGQRLLWSLRPPVIPESLAFSLDLPALLFALGACLFVAVLFALAPLTQMLKVDLSSAFKVHGEASSGGTPKVRTRSLLVAAQVTLSLMALVCASVFTTNVRRAGELDLGFETDDLVVLTLDVGGRGYDAPRGRELYRELVRRAQALPQVRSAALSERVSLVRYGFLIGVEPEGREPGNQEGELLVPINTVSERYFKTLGIPLLAGRTFDPTDREGSRRVAVINETMARRFWTGNDAVGKLFRFAGEEEPLEIVGVVGDAVYLSLGEPPSPHVYLPFEQSYAAQMSLHVRTAGDPQAVMPRLRETVLKLDPELAFLHFGVYSDILEEAFWPVRLTAQLSGLFGLIALLLTAVGIYGVINYLVRQRRREVGVRMAMGGSRGEILKLFLVQGTRIILAGVVAGLLLAMVTLRYFGSLLVAIQAPPVGSFVIAIGLLVVIALLAELLAAHRATRVHPRMALRAEV